MCEAYTIIKPAGITAMSDDKDRVQSYEQKLASGAARMARRMGVQFVPDQRWGDVVKASASSRLSHGNGKVSG